jgi:hypothetical protein
VKNIEVKIQKAILSKKLDLNQLGERNWYNYFIRTSVLKWSTNLRDGYKIEVYRERYGDYLTTIVV